MFIVLFSLLVAGLIHANHGGKIIEYLLQQLKNATSDVSFTSAWIFQVTYYKYWIRKHNLYKNVSFPAFS